MLQTDPGLPAGNSLVCAKPRGDGGTPPSPFIPCTSSDPASTSSAMLSHSLPQQSSCWVSPHPWLLEEELLLNYSSAANPKFRCSAFEALPALWVPGEPEVANAQGRKSPHKPCSSRLTFSSRDRFSSAQPSGSSIFLAAALLQDVLLLPGKSFAGSRGLEEGEWCDSPRRTGPSTQQEKFSFLELFSFDLRIFNYCKLVSAPGSVFQQWGHSCGHVDPRSASSQVRALPNVQTEQQETGQELDSRSLQVPSNSGCSVSPRF